MTHFLINEKIKGILYRRNNILNTHCMCWMCFKNTQCCHTDSSYSHENNFFQAEKCCTQFQYMACWRRVKHANTSNFSKCSQLSSGFYISFISYPHSFPSSHQKCFKTELHHNPPAHLSQSYSLQHLYSHVQYCWQPTPGPSRLEKSGRVQWSPTAISKQPKPPEVLLETQEPLSHKWATGTGVKEPEVKNLKTWTKDRSSGLSAKLIPFSWLYLHIHTECTKL